MNVLRGSYLVDGAVTVLLLILRYRIPVFTGKFCGLEAGKSLKIKRSINFINKNSSR